MKMLLLAALVGLAACSSDAQRMARWQADCEALGFAAGTPSMSDCVLAHKQMREARHNAVVTGVLAN